MRRVQSQAGNRARKTCLSAFALTSARATVAVPASKATVTSRKVTVNAPATNFQVWTPTNNKFFETFSFLPPLSNDEIVKQVNYIVSNGWSPCLEFAEASQAYVDSYSSIRFGNVSCGYQDNRYWTMWKLPMFGCTDGSQVISEMQACTKAFPSAYIRLVAFDSVRQVQTCGFLVHRPAGASEFQAPEKRSVA
jgi:ribulose-bisphosphate carboxylase small chain